METFECGVDRSLVYYLEPLILLGLYCKDTLEISLRGITNDNIDTSIDCIRNGLIPLL